MYYNVYRFAAKQDSLHKSPHLPRKHGAHSNSTGSRTGGANTICSLSPPSTPVESRSVVTQPAHNELLDSATTNQGNCHLFSRSSVVCVHQGVRMEGVETPVSALGASCYSDSSLPILFLC